MPAILTDIRDEIRELKAREDATILAHYYQDGEIQELADYTGDSLNLARAATKVKTSTIVSGAWGIRRQSRGTLFPPPPEMVLADYVRPSCDVPTDGLPLSPAQEA